MKISELIKRLQEFDGDLPVYFSYDSGDYWGSKVASKVSDMNETDLVFSEYHKKMSVPSGDDEEPDDDGKSVTAVVLW